MRPGTRLDRVDALRALALLPVLVVNMGSYRSMDSSSPLLWPAPEGSASAWGVTLLTIALMQGKGITVLSVLVGYTLTLANDPARRARRLLTLGLLHGLLLYYGDILGAYALAMLLALRHRRARLHGLLRRAAFWLALGMGLLGALTAPWGTGSDGGVFVDIAQAQDALAWWKSNAKLSGSSWLLMPLLLPSTYGLVLLGLVAGRLRLLSHRRWAPLWARAARGAGPLLVLNLALAAAVLAGLLGDGVLAVLLLALPTVACWAAWYLSRPGAPSRWLALAGRNTLSVYLGSSLIMVLLFSAAGLNWAAGSVASLGAAVLAWALLCSASVGAARRGRRLPLETWVARP